MFTYSDMLQQMDYDKIIKRINKENDYKFGDKVNIIILTDRLTGCAEGLKQYLDCYSGMTVYIIHNTVEFQKITITPDFLIIVGYFAKSDNYKILENIKLINESVVSIFYARIDGCILSYKQRYNIDECFDRESPIKGFVDFLKNKYEIVRAAKEANIVKPQEVMKKKRGTMHKIFKKIGMKDTSL